MAEEQIENATRIWNILYCICGGIKLFVAEKRYAYNYTISKEYFVRLFKEDGRL